MKQTNFHLFDFLDFDTGLNGNEILWKACKPVNIDKLNNDIIITIPFQKQKCSNEIGPDTIEPPSNHYLRIRGYGEKILRISFDFNVPEMNDSPMLDISPVLKFCQFDVETNNSQWVVKDRKGNSKAVFNLAEAEIKFWSPLLPKPDETLDVTFCPDGKKEIKTSAFDQFFPARQDAMPLAYIENKGITDRTTISFHAEHDEVFAGTGERFQKMDLSGNTIQLENQDGQGVNSRRTYKNIPFYISSKLYGLFLHTSAHSKFSFADHSTRSVQIMSEQPLLDIFMIGGENVEEILYNYRLLTGFPGLPPLWSFGIWMSRMTYFSADEVNEVCHRLREENFPCDVIHLDTGWFRTDWLCEWKFNDERFPDPQKFISGLKSKGFRVSLWQLPYVAANAEQHDGAVKNRFIGIIQKKKKQGGSNFSELDYTGTIDFTYPKAVKWYKGLLKNLLNMGVACIKTDFGESIHMDAEYHGMKPELLHNLYALLYQKAAFEITRDINGEGIIWARSGWAGCQRYPVHWGGDAACSWDGLAGTLKGGLHLGLSGFGFWSHDVPGFHGVPDFMNAVIPDDLYVRWTQFGVFTSHIRYHGTSAREPYHFPNISDLVRRWWKIRYALIPYIYEQSKKIRLSGYPMVRALVFHHPEDKMCWLIHDQYYFGDDFLVAPVMSSDNKRDIYIPEGKWVNFFNGKITDGATWLKNFEVPLSEMPVWVRYGAKITVYPEKVYCTDEMDLSNSVMVNFDDSYQGIDKSVIGKTLEQ
jgi:alpha-D-xyloside xylohydrolase